MSQIDLGKYFGDVLISNEELPYVIQSAQNDCITVETSLAEIKQMEELNRTLEDLLVVGSKIETVTPNEVMLVDAVHRTALAGTDITVNEITPNLESYVNGKINFEGLGAYVDASWKIVTDGIKKIWSYIADIIYKYFGAIPRLRSNLEKLKKKIQEGDFDHVTVDISTTLGIELFNLSRNDKLPKNAHEIIEGLNALKTQIDYYLGTFINTSLDIYSRVIDEFNNFNEADPSLSVKTITDTVYPLTSAFISPAITTTQTTDKRFGVGYVELPPLPGNKTIFLRKQEVDPSSDVITKADIVLSLTPMLRDSKHSLKKASLTNSIPGVYPNEALQICDICLECLELVEKVFRGDVHKEIKEKKEELIKASEALISRANNLETGDAKVIYYRTAVKFNSFMTNTYYQLVIGLSNLTVGVCNNAGVVCSKAFK